MITAALLYVSLSSAFTPSPALDPWFGEDKLKHFFTSFVVTTLSASSARIVGMEPQASLWVGAGVATGAGLYKEISDARGDTRFSYRDLLWDFGGIAAAGTVIDAAR